MNNSSFGCRAALFENSVMRKIDLKLLQSFCTFLDALGQQIL